MRCIGRLRPDGDGDNGTGGGDGAAPDTGEKADEWKPPSREEWEKTNERIGYLDVEAKRAYKERDEERASSRTLMERVSGAFGSKKEEEVPPDYGDLSAEDRKYFYIGERRAEANIKKHIEALRAELGPLAQAGAQAAYEKSVDRAEQDMRSNITRLVGDDETTGAYPLAAPEAVLNVYAALGAAVDNGRMTREDFNKAVEAAAKRSHDATEKAVGRLRQRQEAERATRAAKKVEARRGGGFRSGMPTPETPPKSDPTRAGFKQEMRDFLASNRGA